MSRVLVGLCILAALVGCRTSPTADASRPPPSQTKAAGAVEGQKLSVCDAATQSQTREIEGLRGQERCTFDTDCAWTEVANSCFRRCDVAVHPALLTRLGELTKGLETRFCGKDAGRCAPLASECAALQPRCVQGRCEAQAEAPPIAATPIPAENLANLREAPPRPSFAADDERPRRLFQAIVQDSPDLARDFFFPREAFKHVKAMDESDRYWRRLYARFETDIHALHTQTPDLARAEYDSLELSRRGAWMRPGEEGNRLPYWAARFNRLFYRVDGERRSLELRVLIQWGERWYLIHLSEFK